MTTAKSASRKQTDASPQMEAFRLLFENHPVPMWVYDLETLGFLAVNEAAQEKYGYSRDEFLGMTLKDIRPLEDIPRLQADVERARPALQHCGLWRHRLKDGTLIDMEITSHTIEYEGRKAALVLAQNVTGRAQAERALQAGEERYRAFVQNSSEAIWCLELDQPLSATLPLEQQVDWLFTHASVVDCNDAMAVMHAYASREEMLGLQLSGLLPRLSPGNLKLIRDFIGNGYQINERESVELSHDVELRYFVSSLTGIVEESALRRIWGVKRDVTERKQAEEALRLSETRYRRLHESMRDCFVQTKMSGEIVDVNPAYLAMLGYSTEEVFKLRYQDLTPERWHTFELELVETQILTLGHSNVYEKEYIKKDGTVFPVELRTFLLRDAEGKPSGMWAIVRDITERKQAEESLLKNNRRLETLNRVGMALAETTELSSAYHTAHTHVSQLLDCPCFGISLYDASTRTLRADYMLSDGELLDAARFPPLLFDESQSLAGRARAIFTQRPELMNNLPSIPSKETVIVSAPSDDRVPRSALYLPMVVSGQTIGLLELQSYRENAYGEEETSLLVPVANQIGLAIENARLFTDLEGERNLLAQRVTERTAELQAANKELEAFAYSVSHDLRAPLRAMEGFSSFLLSNYYEQLDEQGRHYLDRIQQASQRMGQLINDLLNLSRITRSEFNFQRVDLSVLARAITAELKTRDLQREAEFMIGEPLIVQGDAHLLRIALQNLLENAWKFSSTRPKAVIEAGQMTVAEYQLQNTDSALPFEISNPQSAIYFIRDNGVGFDMTYAAKLFAPFQRLHAMHEFPGTGIGLAIVQRVITRHGGRVWTQAQVGQGATFYFTLGGIS